LDIAKSRLVAFSDILRLPPSTQVSALGSPATNPSLRQALEASTEGELNEIVETIQPEQYEQIAADEKPVTIIQGQPEVVKVS
jgi:hypothetical protein